MKINMMNEIIKFPNNLLVVPQTEIKCASFPVIDAHIHLCGRYRTDKFWERYNIEEIVKEFQSVGVEHLISLELFSKRHWEYNMERTENFRRFFSICAPVDLSLIEKEGVSRIVDDMDYYAQNGAVGFKVWKKLGLTLRRKSGELYRIDDDIFSPIWQKAAHVDMPVIIHVGDPPAFFHKADKCNERFPEFCRYPQWTSITEVEHGDLIGQFERLADANPDVTFVAAHIANIANDLQKAEKMLEAHPNLYYDLSAVLSEIGRQPRRFKKFAEKYSDRLLFGTDYFGGDVMPYIPYFRFLETEDEYFSYNAVGEVTQGQWMIYGCGLSSDILKAIYYDNAKRIFKIS